MDELAVLLNNEFVGAVERKGGGLLEFRYDPSWQDNPLAYPLSLSMPLAKRVHDDSVTRPFLEGLLPDNAAVLASWARTFHVSANNPFSLLSHMGEDCAGAVQFVPFNNLENLRTVEHQVEWLTDEEVADRLRAAARGQGTGRLAGDHGQFSLAGAQPKTALYHDGSGWGIPTGSTPTTHILKPPAQTEFDAFDVNEHFCLELANELGLAAVHSEVRAFGDQQALVVERYDRSSSSDGFVQRVHQEDCCQAMAVLPAYKYEAEGGPGISTLFNLLIDRSTEQATDAGALIDAVTLNWVIGGSDAHAKNYSILLGPQTVRLAPLYDLISALPYMHIRDVKLAMRVGREYHAWKIVLRHWERLAHECALDVEPLVGRVAELVADVPSASERVANRVRAAGLRHEMVDRLEESISLRATELTGLLA